MYGVECMRLIKRSVPYNSTDTNIRNMSDLIAIRACHLGDVRRPRRMFTLLMDSSWRLGSLLVLAIGGLNLITTTPTVLCDMTLFIR